MFHVLTNTEAYNRTQSVPNILNVELFDIQRTSEEMQPILKEKTISSANPEMAQMLESKSFIMFVTMLHEVKVNTLKMNGKIEAFCREIKL